LPSIDPSLYLYNQPKERTPNPELGKHEFLKILMAQLQYQDPLSPMDDREFVSQMTTFSSLEQMMNMANSIDNLVQNQLISPVIQYSHMIGKEVSYETFDEESGEKTGIEKNQVIAVSQKDGWAILELENGDKVYADAIIKVIQAEANDSDIKGSR